MRMQEEVEEPAYRWFSQHRWHSDCGGPLPGLDCQERAYAALVCLYCFWVRPGGDTSRGLNPTDVSAWDGTPGGTPYTQFTIYIRLYKTGSFWEEITTKETIYNKPGSA